MNTMVGIIETEVYGVKAYHCKCLKCAWESRRYNDEDKAIEVGRKHVCKKPKTKSKEN